MQISKKLDIKPYLKTGALLLSTFAAVISSIYLLQNQAKKDSEKARNLGKKLHENPRSYNPALTKDCSYIKTRGKKQMDTNGRNFVEKNLFPNIDQVSQKNIARPEPKQLELNDSNIRRLPKVGGKVEAPPLLQPDPNVERASLSRPSHSELTRLPMPSYDGMKGKTLKHTLKHDDSFKAQNLSKSDITLKHEGPGKSNFIVDQAQESTVTVTDSTKINLKTKDGKSIEPPSPHTAFVAHFGKDAGDVKFEPYYGKLKTVHEVAKGISEATKPINEGIEAVKGIVDSARGLTKEIGALAGSAAGIKETVEYINKKSSNTEADQAFMKAGAIPAVDPSKLKHGNNIEINGVKHQVIQGENNNAAALEAIMNIPTPQSLPKGDAS